MSDGRTKETQRGLGTPPDPLDSPLSAASGGPSSASSPASHSPSSASSPASLAEAIRSLEPGRADQSASEGRAEQTIGHLRVIAPATGTPIVTAESSKPTSARSTGTAAAAAYIEPKTPPPVRPQRSDTVA